MKLPDCSFPIRRCYHKGDVMLARCLADHDHIDLSLTHGLEHPGGYPRSPGHSRACHRYCADIMVMGDLLDHISGELGSQSLIRSICLSLLYDHGYVGLRGALADHHDIDPRFGQSGEGASSNAQCPYHPRAGDVQKLDFLMQCDRLDHILFGNIVPHDLSSWVLGIEGALNPHRDTLFYGWLDGSGMADLSPHAGRLHRLPVRDGGYRLGLGHYLGIRGHDAGALLPEPDLIRIDRRTDQSCGKVGATTAKGGIRPLRVL